MLRSAAVKSRIDASQGDSMPIQCVEHASRAFDAHVDSSRAHDKCCTNGAALSMPFNVSVVHRPFISVITIYRSPRSSLSSFVLSVSIGSGEAVMRGELRPLPVTPEPPLEFRIDSSKSFGPGQASLDHETQTQRSSPTSSLPFVSAPDCPINPISLQSARFLRPTTNTRFIRLGSFSRRTKLPPACAPVRPVDHQFSPQRMTQALGASDTTVSANVARVWLLLPRARPPLANTTMLGEHETNTQSQLYLKSCLLAKIGDGEQ